MTRDGSEKGDGSVVRLYSDNRANPYPVTLSNPAAVAEEKQHSAYKVIMPRVRYHTKELLFAPGR